MRTAKKHLMGFIGCGHMGLAIARGAVMKEYLERYQVCVYDPNPDIQTLCKREGFTILTSEKEVCEEAHVVLLAVTPQKCDEVLSHMQDVKIDTLVSIVTGVSIHHLQEMLNNVPVIRAMPNTPLQINEGATALCRSDNCKADEYDFVYKLFDSMGVTRTIPEDKMNEMVSVHGSTPAYLYYFTECILKDIEARGVDPDAARALLVQTLIGSAKLMQREPQRPLQEFIDEVCSKGGTTIEAIGELKNRNLEETVAAANEKCISRARELGK